jgi:hypothetical protein
LFIRPDIRRTTPPVAALVGQEIGLSGIDGGAAGSFSGRVDSSFSAVSRGGGDG